MSEADAAAASRTCLAPTGIRLFSIRSSTPFADSDSRTQTPAEQLISSSRSVQTTTLSPPKVPKERSLDAAGRRGPEPARRGRGERWESPGQTPVVQLWPHALPRRTASEQLSQGAEKANPFHVGSQVLDAVLGVLVPGRRLPLDVG